MSACPNIFAPGIVAEGAPDSVNSVRIGSETKLLPLDNKLYDKSPKDRLIVYGNQNDVKDDLRYEQTYDSSTKQWRYIGYTSGDTAFFNKDYPPDATATTDVSTRNWISEPWKNPPNSSHSAKQASWWGDYTKQQRGEWLQGIYDKYTKQTGGNWKKFPSPWYETIDDFFVWEQQPTSTNPGIVTGWHTRASGDWYDTFYIAPLEAKYDIALNPLQADVDEAGEWVTISTFSNFQYRQLADFEVKFHTNPDGSGLIEDIFDPSAKIEGATTAGGTANGSTAFGGLAQVTGIQAPSVATAEPSIFSPVNISLICKDVKAMPNVWNTADAKVLEHEWLNDAIPYVVGVTGNYGKTEMKIKLPNQIKKKLEAGEKVYMTGTINKSRDPDEQYWSNNSATWLLTMGNFKTPPIYFKDITKTSSIAYWNPLPEETVDHYELICTDTNTMRNTGKNAEWALTGLTPNTTYHCKLEAFNPEGQSGGIEEGSFTTLPDDTVTPPPAGGVTTPPSPGGSGSGWKEIGLIREIGAVKQSNPSSTAYPKTVNDYSAIKSNTSLANTYTPYFGEKIGMYAIPNIGTATYTWNFSYTDSEWDSCKSTDSEGKCVGGYVSVTRTATDSCTVKYPMAGPTGLGSTTSNPMGKTVAITTKWGKTGVAKVTDVESGECRGSHPRNPSPYKFTYYYPTMIEIAPTLLIDKGFDPTYQKIEDAWKDMWISMEASSYSIGSDGRSLSGTASPATISFKMLWSRYGNIGTGG
jgi:hypothetical protein